MTFTLYQGLCCEMRKENDRKYERRGNAEERRPIYAEYLSYWLFAFGLEAPNCSSEPTEPLYLQRSLWDTKILERYDAASIGDMVRETASCQLAGRAWPRKAELRSLNRKGRYGPTQNSAY